MLARHKQIGQRADYDQAVGVLRQSAIAHLDKTEHPFDDPDGVFTPCFREGRLLARTFDLVRFFARSVSSTTPRWRWWRWVKSLALGAFYLMIAC
jgi:hypothetical protein